MAHATVIRHNAPSFGIFLNMFAKFGCYIKEALCDIKRKITANKAIFYVAIGAAVLGILIALGKNYADCETSNNFILIVINGSASPVPEILRIILWVPVAYICVIFTSIHFVTFVVIGFGGIVLGSYLMMRSALIAIAVDPITGFPYLLAYVLPVLLISLVCVICTLQEINLLIDFPRNYKYFTSIKCTGNSLRKIIKPHFLVNLVAILAYWLLFYLILLLFR